MRRTHKFEYSTREIAAALNITTDQVLSAERSAMKKLSVLLEFACHESYIVDDVWMGDF